jgi:preprotein translocase subunit SecF
LLVVVSLFFFGGEIIHDFSFALLVGVMVGTYSSIFIASVFLVFWDSRRRA